MMTEDGPWSTADSYEAMVFMIAMQYINHGWLSRHARDLSRTADQPTLSSCLHVNLRNAKISEYIISYSSFIMSTLLSQDRGLLSCCSAPAEGIAQP